MGGFHRHIGSRIEDCFRWRAIRRLLFFFLSLHFVRSCYTLRSVVKSRRKISRGGRGARRQQKFWAATYAPRAADRCAKLSLPNQLFCPHAESFVPRSRAAKRVSRGLYKGKIVDRTLNYRGALQAHEFDNNPGVQATINSPDGKFAILKCVGEFHKGISYQVVVLALIQPIHSDDNTRNTIAVVVTFRIDATLNHQRTEQRRKKKDQNSPVLVNSKIRGGPPAAAGCNRIADISTTLRAAAVVYSSDPLKFDFAFSSLSCSLAYPINPVGV